MLFRNRDESIGFWPLIRNLDDSVQKRSGLRGQFSDTTRCLFVQVCFVNEERLLWATFCLKNKLFRKSRRKTPVQVQWCSRLLYWGR